MNSTTALRPFLPVVDHAASAPTPTRALEGFVGLQCTDRAAREEILHRAYGIWEREGHPHDRKLANWLEAETEVLGHG